MTLPAELRRRHDIHAGDDLIFSETSDGVRVRVVHRKRLSEYRGALPIEGDVHDHAEERRLAAEAMIRRAG